MAIFRAAVAHAGRVVAVGYKVDPSLGADGLIRAGDWHSIAAAADRMVLVGATGAIVSGRVTSHDNAILVSLPQGPFFGAPATLSSREQFGAGTTWQWYHPWNQAIPGATGPVLEIPNLELVHSGDYRLTIGRVDGGPKPVDATTSFHPRANPGTLGSVDTAFRVPFRHPPEVVEPLPDGRIYVADSQAFYRIGGRFQHGLVRLLEDGSYDPTFDVGSGIDPEGKVEQFFPHESGSVVIRGRFRTVNGIEASGLVRLRADGSVDTSFQPDSELRNATRLIVQLRDQRWLTIGYLSTREPAPVVRFDANGRRQASLSLPQNPIFPSEPIRALLDAEGRVYLIADYNSSSPEGLLLRLSADGSHDPTFGRFAAFATTDRRIADAIFLDRGLLTAAETEYSSSRGHYILGALRLRRFSDGAVDPSFRERLWNLYWTVNPFTHRSGPFVSRSDPYYGFDALAADGRGGVYAHTSGSGGRLGIVRLDDRGERDPEFSLECVVRPLFRKALRLRADRDGRVLVSNVESVDGVSVPGLVRLIPSRTAGAVGFSNLSVRAIGGTGERTLIVGCITSHGETTVLARGAGPALASFGVSDTLSDPRISVFRGPVLMADNDDWSRGAGATEVATAATRVGAFAFGPGSRDAALLTAVPAGATTIHLTASDGRAGVALGEIYLASALPSASRSPRVASFSVRAHAGVGAESLIAGFTLAGAQTRTILIRVLGSSLTGFGVGNVLAQPRAFLFRGGTMIAEVRPGTANSPDVAEASHAAGAFVIDPQLNEAALVTTLAPGGDSLQVSGVGGGTGVVLLEVFEVP